ncbi:hypothetical protein EJB05_45596, partial [Eragrostis curvula]
MSKDLRLALALADPQCSLLSAHSIFGSGSIWYACHAAIRKICMEHQVRLLSRYLNY